MNYVVTLDEFKRYFMRESGVEYQPYPTFVKTTYDMGARVNHNGTSWESIAQDNITEPGTEDAQWLEAGFDFNPEYPEWVAPIAYQTDDNVVYYSNFKPTVWTSLVDDNYTEPGSDDEKWEENDQEEEYLPDWVLDADIERAMGEAAFKFNKRLFPEDKGRIIFLYLTMFFLVYDKQMAASGINSTSAAGPVIHRTVGKMTVTYMESTLYKGNPSYEFLASNDYGKKAYQLMSPYLRGGVRTFIGGNTGD